MQREGVSIVEKPTSHLPTHLASITGRIKQRPRSSSHRTPFSEFWQQMELKMLHIPGLGVRLGASVQSSSPHHPGEYLHILPG